MDVQVFGGWLYRWLITTGLELLVVLLATIAALWGARILVDGLTERIANRSDDPEGEKRATTLGEVVRYSVRVVIWVVAGFIILSTLGIDIGPLLAAAGVVGLAVGFGAQRLVEDVIAGFFILLEDQIRVGDVVQVAGKSGLVEQVNLRMVVLRDASGNVHYVRNNQIDVVTNLTKEYSYYVFDIGVAYQEDVDDVMEVMKEVGSDLRADEEYAEDILDDLEIMGLDRFGDSAVVIKARIKTRPIKQWRVGREFNRRLKVAFDSNDIEMPFPHMTVYMGEEKDGTAPPMRLKVEDDGLNGSVE